MDKDVTELVDFGLNDDECLPLTKCVCGRAFFPWDFQLGIYRDSATECHECGRKFFFQLSLRVFEVVD